MTSLRALRPFAPVAARPTVSRFVQLVPERLDALCATHGLGGHERRLLVDLLLDASWQTHAVAGFTLTDYAARLGFGPSYRRTLKGQLARLEAAGLIRYEAGRGTQPGTVEILAYGEVVRMGSRAVARAGETPATRGNARSTWDTGRVDLVEEQDPLAAVPQEHEPVKPPDGGADSTSGAAEVLDAVAAQLGPAQRRNLFRPDDRRCRAQLLNGITCLLRHLNAPAVADCMLRPRLPDDVTSVAGLLSWRVRRRLADVEDGGGQAVGADDREGSRQAARAHGETLGRIDDADSARQALEYAYAGDEELLDLALAAEAATRSQLAGACALGVAS